MENECIPKSIKNLYIGKDGRSYCNPKDLEQADEAFNRRMLMLNHNRLTPDYLEILKTPKR